jgi:phosphohistidine phosphatase
MDLYLIRHAHAVAADDDAERPLSKKGREQVKRLADFLRTSDAFRPEEIWHSPLLRSQQTARLLAKKLHLPVPLIEVAGLEPEDDPRATSCA